MSRRSKDLPAGTLVKRDGRFYLRIVFKGKPVVRSLDTTNRRQAVRKARSLVAAMSGGSPDERAATMDAIVTRGRRYQISDGGDGTPGPARSRALQGSSGNGAGGQPAASGQHLLSGISLQEAWELFAASRLRRVCSPATLLDYDCLWTSFVAWVEKHHPEVKELSDISLRIVQAYQASLAGLSSDRQNKRILLCRMLYGIITKQKHIEALEAAARSGGTAEVKTPANPFAYVTSLPKSEQNRRELTVSELKRVCSTATGEMQVAFAIGLFTCLRLADVCTLRWDEVDFQAGTITRVPNKTRLRTAKAVVVRIHPVLLRFLQAVPEDQRQEYVLPGLAVKYKKDRSYVCRTIQKHLRSCGIETTVAKLDQARAVCKVGFHSLRHTFVTISKQQGQAAAVVQELCGHSNPMMQKKYTHVGADITFGAVMSMPAGMFGEPVQEVPREVSSDTAPLKKMLALVERLNGKNWQEVQARLRKILTANGERGVYSG